jgi:threonine/homoserine/homoserine lactone efflux protein
MTLSFFAVFLSTVLLASITPGPSMLLALNHGIAFGWRRSLATAWGNVCATALQCLVSFAGLGFILGQAAWVFSVIRYVGAAYLVYLGCRLLFGPVDALGGAGAAAGTRRSLFREAFVVTASNPKAVIFFSALFPQFFADGKLPLAKATMMLAAVLLTTFACMMLYATTGARIQGLFGRPRFRRLFQRGVGAVLAAFGLGLALERR